MTASAISVPPRAQYPWWHLLLEGLVSVVIGWLLIRRPEASLGLALQLLGIYWFGLGLISLLLILTRRGSGRRISLLVRGGLGLLAGLLVLNLDPLARATGGPNLINTTIAVAGVVMGLISLMQAFQGGGLASGLLGVLSLIFAFFVAGNVVFNLLDIVWLLGWVALVAGLATVVSAFAQRARVDAETNPALGIWRVVALLTVLFLGIIVIFVTWLSHVRRQGVRLHQFVISLMCRIILRLFRLQVVCADPATIAGMQGIVYVNHLTFMDIPVVASLGPMRFLSTEEVFHIPVIGWIAAVINTVFVDRGSKSSRSGTRDRIARSLASSLTPPFVIFPEGRFGTPTSLRHFHPGSFDVAVEHAVPYLPVALYYDRMDIMWWQGVKEENFGVAAWRVLAFRGHLQATLLPLSIVNPQPGDDPLVLAQAAQDAVAAALGYAPDAGTEQG